MTSIKFVIKEIKGTFSVSMVKTRSKEPTEIEETLLNAIEQGGINMAQKCKELICQSNDGT
jgi:glutathione synthase/RimK-type ligase-like ATP-grasp enzyme